MESIRGGYLRLSSDKKSNPVSAPHPRGNDQLLPHHQGVAQSLFFIAKNHTQPICIKDLVRVSTMSKRGFHKAFKRHLKRTPRVELEVMRIDQAKKTIIESRLELKTVAAMCGYQSVNTFYVAFKRVVGMAPGKFRKINKS